MSDHQSSHVVQFYEDERFLHGAVAAFLAEGLNAGRPGVVIAEPQNRRAFAERLAAHGFDPPRLEHGGDLTLLDARETLSTFMVGPTPDVGRFRDCIGGVISKSRRGRDHVNVLAYGEMVDVLWRDGNPDAAIRLEEMWNELASTHRLSLLCGYAMRNFDKDAHWRLFQDICRRHSQVLPSERYLQAVDDVARLREITLLQQRARALEHEIAERQALERSLRQALADGERAEAIKDEFLAVLSHELRTPLNAILGWTRIARDGRADFGTVRRALEVIDKNAALQRHLVDDLLDVSRILSGKLQVKSEPIDLPDVLAAAVDTVRPAADAKAIVLELHVDHGVGRVNGDRDRLQQVMWNLLSNAIKFTPNNGRVDLRLEQRDSHAEIVVRDTGEGIAPDFLPQVFDRFRQADAGTARRHRGLGLGLAVVRYLVEAHGGTVRAESAGVGRGATFIVSLPIL